jgi:hypothetical protein
MKEKMWNAAGEQSEHRTLNIEHGKAKASENLAICGVDDGEAK